jgi:hypothetical protein
MGYLNGEIDHTVENDNQPVELTIHIGAGQETLKVTVWPPVGPRLINPAYPLNLGLGSAVRNNYTDLLVRITDDNPNTDDTSVKVDLTNGATSKTFELAAETPGGTVDYYITIKHT